ncbi:hypothetical protein B0H19DRAFT_242244 [Mycena capillaripes]|nr:hypothetical protein B0H19DRAFT_242244 [Mycena capillaripes]
MPPRTSTDRDSAVHYEPLRASVLDVFEQLGAFDDHSGIVEWIFPEFHEEKEVQTSRVKLTEVFDPPEPVEPETPRKSRTSRFFRLGTKSRSKSRSKKEDSPLVITAPTKQKPKKTRSSPDLRKKAAAAAEGKSPETPVISLPIKQTTMSSAEHKSKRLSLFPRKAAAQSLDQPRPSISDEEWQQITMTGSIAEYGINPFLGTDPHSENDATPVKRDGLQKHFSRFTGTFTRSTPTSPIRARSSLSGTAPTSPTQEHHVSPLAAPGPASPVGDDPQPTSDPTTPTGPPPPLPTSPAITSHSNASNSTLHAAPDPPAPEPAPVSPEVQEVPRDDAIETTRELDHVRKSLSDISEGEVSESSTISIKSSRKSHDGSATEEAS